MNNIFAQLKNKYGGKWVLQYTCDRCNQTTTYYEPDQPSYTDESFASQIIGIKYIHVCQDGLMHDMSEMFKNKENVQKQRKCSKTKKLKK